MGFIKDSDSLIIFKVGNFDKTIYRSNDTDHEVSWLKSAYTKQAGCQYRKAVQTTAY